MKKFRIYHNPRCRTSRAGLQYLQEKGVDLEIIEYIKHPLSSEQFGLLLQKLHKKPAEILRTQEAVYKKEFKGRQFTDDEWIKIMIENPALIQRPIVESGHKAILAQPPEEIDKLL